MEGMTTGEGDRSLDFELGLLVVVLELVLGGLVVEVVASMEVDCWGLNSVGLLLAWMEVKSLACLLYSSYCSRRRRPASSCRADSGFG